MSRWKAASIHLLLSVLIVSSVALGLIFAWYGWELFTTMGVVKLLGLLAVCDVVIGPLLTLIVFRSGKPSLRFDLTVIALLQIAFLGYGLYVMAQSRPVFMVAVKDRFDLVFANELDPADLAKGGSEEHRTLSWSGPRLVGGKLAQNSDERMSLALSGLDGRDIQMLPERYLPYEEVAAAMLREAQAPEELLKSSKPEAAAKLRDAIASTGREETQVRVLPIISKRGRATMLIAADSGAVLRSVAVDPWPDLGE
jgi:hypothetical protein